MKKQDNSIKGANYLVREIFAEEVSYGPRVGITRGKEEGGCSKNMHKSQGREARHV